MTPFSDTSQTELAANDTQGRTPAIATHGLSKHFGQRKAVDGLTISIPAGTIAGFVGPNGAGKTTTIRLLLGLVRPSEGSATILGTPLTHPECYLPRVGGGLPPLPRESAARTGRVERPGKRPGEKVFARDEATARGGHGPAP